MPAYLVQLAAKGGRQLIGGHNARIVFAADAQDAKDIAAAQFDGGDSDAAWGAATATEIVAPADLTGFVFKMVVDFAGGPEEFVHTGVGADTFDIIGAAMVVLLNASANLAACTYTAATQTILIPLANNVGDRLITATISWNGKPITGFVVSITAEGAPGIDRSIVLAADAYVLPQVMSSLKA